jgi:hypothetical protein
MKGMEGFFLRNSAAFLTLLWTGKRGETSKRPHSTKNDTAGELLRGDCCHTIDAPETRVHLLYTDQEAIDVTTSATDPTRP